MLRRASLAVLLGAAGGGREQASLALVSDQLPERAVELLDGLIVLPLSLGLVGLAGQDGEAIVSASAHHAFCKWDGADAVMVLHVKWALPLVTIAVEFAHTLWVLEACDAEVSVTSAVVGSQVAALVALELDVVEAVLVAEELIADAKLSKRAVAADHLLLLVAHLSLDPVHSTVAVAAEEGVVAAVAFVVQRLLEGDLGGLSLVASVHELGDLVCLHVLDGVGDDVALEDADLVELLVELAHVVGLGDVLGAGGALEEVEVDGLVGPASSDEHAQAVSVKDVAAPDLDARLLGLLLSRALVIALSLLWLEVLGTDGADALDILLSQVDVLAGNAHAALLLAKLEWLAGLEGLHLQALPLESHLKEGVLRLVAVCLHLSWSSSHERVIVLVGD